MKQYLEPHDWKIIERGFNKTYQRVSESIFSLGNGRFGQRGNFEEHYSGDSLQGNYFAGVYYPDKTRVGWWKIGYPEYFAKVLNAVDWAGVDIHLAGEQFDLNQVEPQEFVRELDMKSGVLARSYKVDTPQGRLKFEWERFCSMADKDVGAVRLKITSESFSGSVRFNAYLDWDVENEDANWDEKFWLHRDAASNTDFIRAMAETKKTGFVVSSAAVCAINGERVTANEHSSREKYCSMMFSQEIQAGETLTFEKFTGHQSTLYHDQATIYDGSLATARNAAESGYDKLKSDHERAWDSIWAAADIQIEGDTSAQQGIRFNIFQLFQTYTGDDPRLNIGPKGFTGEKYGGSTYWDTEAYCIPFYLGSADSSIARQLLVYRYRHLQKAIENAELLGFSNGAALYPMVTMNGEECHNEWEITFEEIHRNGAIAYAIHDYIEYTGDESYLLEGGLEVLIGIARFWEQRVHWSKPKGQYVMHGVTGPNEYENNVNNNWYTNLIARWCLNYAADCIEHTRANNGQIISRVGLKDDEIGRWREVAGNIYLPEDKELGIYLQQEGYLDKEVLTVDDIPADQRPINQNWSWDRILRSCFIKQADVLQGLFFFEDQYDDETLRRNFEFYEPRTVHESSLSPCVHSVLASHLGMHDKAYEMYLRTARLDLEDYNNDTEEGLHITSMAGTWMAIVKGFGGVRTREHLLHLRPSLPASWESLAFKLRFRSNLLECRLIQRAIRITNAEGPDIQIFVHGTEHSIPAGEHIVIYSQTAAAQ